MRYSIAIAVIWISIGIYNYGSSLGSMTESYGCSSHTKEAVFLGVTGPFGLLPTLIDRPQRLLWKPLTKEQRWTIYHAKYPRLLRCDFEETYGDGKPCEEKLNDLQLLRKIEAAQ